MFKQILPIYEVEEISLEEAVLAISGENKARENNGYAENPEPLRLVPKTIGPEWFPI
ncbi:MAG: hypothetical protein OEZ33_09205 [Gammaproteobacteria bacterium]|nr:hypothetical protein [Gammaproteobacteria bacterium]MDH5778376.1 hypothetical protein [Gammaproteobacteria bacterium]